MMRFRARAAVSVGIAMIVVVAAGGAIWVFRPSIPQTLASAGAASDVSEPVTAPVELATITNRVQLNAQLGYGEAVPLAAASGMITALPAAGSIIRTGERVYETDGRPVVLLHGERPFWRALAVGAAPGPDIRQLEQNLASFGLFDAEPDETFDGLTRAGVREWQQSLGLAPTGEFSPGDAVVAEAPGIRVAQVTAHLGDSGASPATVTETTLRATAGLTEAQARELTAGTPVTVALPDGSELPSALASVDRGGVPTGEGGELSRPTATIEFPDQSAVAAAGPVAVRVVIDDDVQQPETLVVPATALIADADGGYAVEVYAHGAIERIPVRIGLVADARVQVLDSGPGLEHGAGRPLSEGDLVVLAR